MLTKTDHSELVGLRESVEKYRKMLDLAPDAIITVDPLTGRILEVNQKAIELTGYGTEELIGIEMGGLHPQQEREAVRRLLREVENNGSGALTNLHFCRKDGTSLAIEVSANMISFGSKHLIQQVCHDLTARNQLVNKTLFSTVSASVFWKCFPVTELSTQTAVIHPDYSKLLKTSATSIT